MGWSSGTRLFHDVMRTVEKNVKDSLARREIYDDLIDAFEDFDCDNLDECEGESDDFDFVWSRRYPEDPE